MEIKPKYVLKNKAGDSWFKQQTIIGPMFTPNQSEAMICDERTDFASYMNHFGMASYHISEI